MAVSAHVVAAPFVVMLANLRDSVEDCEDSQRPQEPDS